MKLIPFFLLIAFLSYAQDYSVEILKPQKGKTQGADYIGLDNNGNLYTASMKISGLIFVSEYLKVIDPASGRIISEVKLGNNKNLKKAGYDYVDIRVIRGELVLICKNKKSKEPYFLLGISLDDNGNFVGAPFRIAEVGECGSLFNRNNSLPWSFSDAEGENESHFFLSEISCQKDKFREYRFIELDQMNDYINDFSFKIELDNIVDYSVLPYGNHLYYSSVTIENQKIEGKLFKQNRLVNKLFKIDINTLEVEEIDLYEGIDPIYAGRIVLDRLDDKVLISGQMMEEKGFTGVFTAQLDTATNEFSAIKTNIFPREFVTKFWSSKKKQKDDKKQSRKGDKYEEPSFNTNFKLMETHETEDGGQISIYQKYAKRTVTRTSTSSDGGASTTTDDYYSYGDAMFIKTDTTGKLKYVKLLPFNQTTKNYDPGKSFVSMAKDNQFYIIHDSNKELHDKIINEENSDEKQRIKDRMSRYYSITRIDENGKITTEQVLDRKETKISGEAIHLLNIAANTERGEFILLTPVYKMAAFNRRKTKLVRFSIN